MSGLLSLRPISEPFTEFLASARRVLVFWARFVGGVVCLGLLFGPFAPLAVAAFLLTLGLPILLLILWGKSLDTELGWTDLEGGPH